MPKTDESFDPTDYAPVAERVTLFYARYPHGRIVTRLVKESARRVLFEARVYRSPDEPRPSATGWAAERPGDGMINTVACIENTETSAIGRALANLGLTAGRRRPSLEEMVKAARARQASSHVKAEDTRPPAAGTWPSAEGTITSTTSPRSTIDGSSPERIAPLASEDDRLELWELCAEAERAGTSETRLAEIRRLSSGAELTALEAAALRDALARSVVRRRAETGSAEGEP